MIENAMPKADDCGEEYVFTPERNLWIAHIEVALRDLKKKDAKKCAYWWVFSDDDETIEDSLAWVCEMIGLNVDFVRGIARQIVNGEKTPNGRRNADM